MINTILGSKGKNSQTFIEGFKVPVTKVMAGPCVVTQVKTLDRDGYWAIQIGFLSKRPKNTSKPLQGHLNKITTDKSQNTTYPRYLREIRLTKEPVQKVGDIIAVGDVLRAGDVISVSAVSKGKGFAGVVKKHGFRGGPRTHGQSDRERAPGSIGQTTTPGRVYKGKRMAGRMGGEMVTIKNLHVISVDKETSEVQVSGQIPGTIGSLVTINKIKSGSLKELEHEVVAQVVEGEGESEGKEDVSASNEAAASQGGQENNA